MNSPIGAYRWEFTDRALTEQLLLEDEGQPATVAPGHAAIRYTNPTTGGDGMSTIRLEFHRLRPGAETATRREVGSTVFQVFDGTGAVVLNGETHKLEKGDMFVIPSWIPWSLQAESRFDLFRFSDCPDHGAARLYARDGGWRMTLSPSDLAARDALRARQGKGARYDAPAAPHDALLLAAAAPPISCACLAS